MAKAKPKLQLVDGLNEKDVKNIQRVLRQVWSWSYSWRLVKKRCDVGDGYAKCEKCKKRVPKVFVDHIECVGSFDHGYIARLFVPSKRMQGLCNDCHKVKTKLDLKIIKAQKALKDVGDFY